MKNPIKALKHYLLMYNINAVFTEILTADKPLSRPEREQFWRMVSYRDHGRW